MVGRALSTTRRWSQEKGSYSHVVFSCLEKQMCTQWSPHHLRSQLRTYLQVPLTGSLGSTLRLASEQTLILSVLHVLKDTFGKFLFLHL